MSTHLHTLFLGVCVILAVLLTGCMDPRPPSFIDAAALPPEYVGREHKAYASGARLVVKVSQIPGLNVAGLDAFEQDGSLYVSPRRISSGGEGTAQFEVDVSKFHLGADWPQHVYWLLESYSYPITTPGFWSSKKRSPWVRKKVEVSRQ